MKTSIACLTLVSLTLLSGPAQAAPDAVVTHASLELRDGSRVVGVFAAKTLAISSASLGELKLPVESIRTVEWPADKPVAALVATNGDKFSVELRLTDLPLASSFGDIKVPVAKIRSLRFWTDVGGRSRVPGLVALWAGDGNGNDSAGTNNATLSGNATYAPGKIGQAFSLDGVNSFVKIPQSADLNFADQLTISFWMKADAGNPMNTIQGLVTSDFYVIEISGGPGGRMGVNFATSTTANPPPMGWGSSGPMTMPMYDDSTPWGGRRGITSSMNFRHTSQANDGGAQVSPGEWHHIVATYDGAQMQLYVDGQPAGNPMRQSGTIRPMLPNSFLAIGSEDGRNTCPQCVANRYFKGLIDEVGLYNRALSADEIRQLFDAGNAN